LRALCDDYDPASRDLGGGVLMFRRKRIFEVKKQNLLNKWQKMEAPLKQLPAGRLIPFWEMLKSSQENKRQSHLGWIRHVQKSLSQNSKGPQSPDGCGH
jgi:hypothetical protein